MAIVTADSERGRYTIRHSTAHVLAQAVLDLFPGSTFAIGPPIEDGFYYDFELPAGGTFTPDDLERIEARMREIIAEEQPFIRDEIAEAEAKLFAHHPYKLEILEGAANDPMSATDKGLARTYENPPRFIDLCRGPHVPHTGRLGHFKLLRVAGAYWRGDERNPVLQRSMARRGSPRRRSRTTSGVWPRPARPPAPGGRARSALVPGRARGRPGRLASAGAIVRKIIEDYSRERHERGGYQFRSVRTSRSTLWEISGHLDWYADAMYPPMVLDEQQYYPKPMNCPFHMLIFRSRQRSYRELPIRLFELGTVYRYERSGVLHGLMRIRGSPRTTATSSAPVSSSSTRSAGSWTSAWTSCGRSDSTISRPSSTRPQDRSVGDDDEWDEATTALRTAIERAGLEYEVAEGEGASTGRRSTCTSATPSDGAGSSPPSRWTSSSPSGSTSATSGRTTPHRPCVIHRALMGSIERFFGVLLEHPRGRIPVWLAPEQVRVLPVSDDHQEYAEGVVERLVDQRFRAELAGGRRPPGRGSVGPSWRRCHTSSWSERTTWGPARSGSTRAQEVERDVPLDDFIERLATDVAERR